MAGPQITVAHISKARLAGVFYLLTFVSGAIALASGTGMAIANGIATVAYVGVTVLFYQLFKPVSSTVSAIAAVFSLIGCAIGALTAFHVAVPISSLAFFGAYCILIGYLIVRSPFLPSIVGVLLVLGGLSWLTFAWPPLAHSLSPFNYGPGILAEGLLTLWLLIFGARVAQPGGRVTGGSDERIAG